MAYTMASMQVLIKEPGLFGLPDTFSVAHMPQLLLVSIMMLSVGASAIANDAIVLIQLQHQLPQEHLKVI